MFTVSNDPKKAIKQLVASYPTLFDGTLGHCHSVRPKLYLKPNATPVFQKALPLPFAIRARVEGELNRMVGMNILSPIQTSDWASSIVPVTKPNGDIRICGNFKNTLNPNLLIDSYPLPLRDDIFAKLANGKKFTKLDMSDAYLQLEPDEESKALLVLNTHLGLFKCNRLMFGLAPAPAKFQQIIDQIIPKRHGIAAYLDDIIITGKDDLEHVQNLRAVFQVLQDHGFKVKEEKCQLFQDSVSYLGHVIDRNGVHMDPHKLDAIVHMPPPQNVTQVRAFMGMVNHYGKFIPNLATIAEPMYSLTRDHTTWNWSKACEKSFSLVKEALTSASFLAHYDVNLPLGLACDASSYGVAAVLFHIFPDGSEHPVGFASKTLNAAEKNYAQIDREALSIVYGIKKFHQYLYGRKFTLYTDHKPLLSIFGPYNKLPHKLPLAACKDEN